MTSLLHQHPPVTDEEAAYYLHQTGPWTRFLVTPWPLQSLVEGAVVLVAGVWAGVALGLSDPWAGAGVAAAGVVLAMLLAAPGAYTETHQEYAARYHQAQRMHQDNELRAHPYLALVLVPLLFAAAGALGGLHSTHETASSRLAWGIGYAVLGFVYVCVRIRRARRHRLD